MAECPICSKRRAPHQKLCAECTAAYGSVVKAWPLWVRELRVIQRQFEAHPGGVTGANGARIELVARNDE